ncbi:MAG: LysM peptidoglycan-binding domain-containing protein [Pirellulales bacterium]
MVDALPPGGLHRETAGGIRTLVRTVCVGVIVMTVAFTTAVVIPSVLLAAPDEAPTPFAPLKPAAPALGAVVAVAEEKPAEEKPAEEKPAADKPAEEKPAEEKPAEDKPAEQAAVAAGEADVAVAADVAVEAVAQPVPNVVNWNYLSDGIMRYGVNGQIREQRTDAVEQASTMYPNIKIARVMPGDTLVKVAEQYGVPVERLALLNRTEAGRVFDAVGVLVVDWKYQWPAGQTLDALAAMLEVPVETLRKLNQMSETDQPKVGQEVLIPGQLMYHSQGREGYLQVAMYGVQTPQNIPYKPETIRMQQQPLAKDQTLTEFAEKHGVKEAFLREMNGLKADEEVPAHTMLLVEYSCELTDKATVDAIVTTFQVDRDRFLSVNGWKEDKDFDVKQRVHLPIGERIRHQVVQQAQQSEPFVPVEFEIEVSQPAANQE